MSLSDETASPGADRYSRQERFAPIGTQGQQALGRGRVLLCGCGALGTVIAETLVRAGVGFVRIVDRDFVEWSNLQRQVLFDEDDVHEQLPKAVAAARKLSRINSRVTIEPIVADVDARNIRELCHGVDVILDGLDNFETRFLINDAALELNLPWVYGGCVGSHGQTMTILPGETACLRCVIESPPEPGTAETCDTAGVIAPAIQVVASLQSVAALKLLTGQRTAIRRELLMVDVWDGTFRGISLAQVREQGACPACQQGRRDWLDGAAGSHSTVLCGRNAVQVTPATNAGLDLAAVAQRWESLGTVSRNPFLVKLTVANPELEVTLFRDGRAIIKGTEDPAAARTAYARYVGN